MIKEKLGSFEQESEALLNGIDASSTATYKGEIRVKTSDPDEFQELFSIMSGDGSMHAYGARSFQFTTRGHLFSKIRLFMARLKNAQVLRPPDSYVGLTIPLDGPFGVATRGAEEVFQPGSAHLLRETREFDFRTLDSTAVLVVNIDADILESHRARLLESESLDQSIWNGGDFPLSTTEGRSLWFALSAAWRELSDSERSRHSTIAGDELQDRILTDFCLSCSEERQKHEPRCRPEYLERAVDYIMVNLSSAISLADLSTVAGVCAVTLIRAFKTTYQQTPIAFIRERRLDAVRRILLASDPEDGLVTRTALRFGCGHLGRFASQYHRSFGEYPSDTLRANTGLGIRK